MLPEREGERERAREGRANHCCDGARDHAKGGSKERRRQCIEEGEVAMQCVRHCTYLASRLIQVGLSLSLSLVQVREVPCGILSSLAMPSLTERARGTISPVPSHTYWKG